MFFSYAVNHTCHTKFVSSLFAAIIPVIEVVTAVFLIGSLPLQESFSLMLDHNAFFKFGIIVLAGVSSVKWDFEGIKFLLFMVFWSVFIIGL